jgi:hypothetical protein
MLWARRGGQQALVLLLLQHSMCYAVLAVLSCPLIAFVRCMFWSGGRGLCACCCCEGSSVMFRCEERTVKAGETERQTDRHFDVHVCRCRSTQQVAIDQQGALWQAAALRCACYDYPFCL